MDAPLRLTNSQTAFDSISWNMPRGTCMRIYAASVLQSRARKQRLEGSQSHLRVCFSATWHVHAFPACLT